MSNNILRFNVYLSGFKFGEVIFNKADIQHSYFDFLEGEFNNLHTYDKSETMFYPQPLDQILKQIVEFDCKCTDEVFVSKSQMKYSKDIEYKAVINGKLKTSQHWASRGNRSVADIIVCEGEVIGFCSIFRGNYYFVKPGYELLTPQRAWLKEGISKAEYEIESLGKLETTMRDGIKLSCYVCRPKTEVQKEFPCVLIRTPYNAKDTLKVVGPFVERGYVAISQNVRGREDSQGEWNPHYHEREDGEDTLNWIAEQEWCNGKIGMIGASYQGNVQWHAAGTGNKHLCAMISQVACGTPFRDVPRVGGAFASGCLAWGFMMKDEHMNPANAERDDWGELFRHRPLNEIVKKGIGEDIPFIKKWMENEPHDKFWENLDWARHSENLNVPTFHISGWYDDDGQGTSQAWEILSKRNVRHQKLLMGPWLHTFNSTRDINGIPYANDSVMLELESEYIRWFDHYLKGMNNGIDNECYVDYYQVGEHQWKRTKEWPPAESFIKKFYISSEGQANTSSGDGVLSPEIISTGHTSYNFDPENPAPYLIDVSENEMATPNNYKDVELREDVLVFTSEILESDFSIAGEIRAELFASSSAVDTDWLIRLTDVDPEGNSLRLSDGLIRAKYREGFDKERFLVPDQIYKYEIIMSRIANTFKKGHRIRLEITSGADNLIFANHNTGNKMSEDIEFVTAKQKIYFGENYPTCIKLPVIDG